MRESTFIVLALIAGCGGDDLPLTHSSPVGINLKAKSGDVKSGVVDDAKEITTESGNPFGAFMQATRDKLGGADPSRVEISSLTLMLGAKSSAVTRLEDVFSGLVEVLFLINDTNNTYPVGSVTSPTGAGPVDLAVSYDPAALSPTDRSKLYAGSFKVVIRGSAAVGFDKKGAEADLQLTFVFTGYQ